MTPNSPARATNRPVPVRRTWSVGTLVYTGSGLTILFFWLLWGDFAWNMKERAATPIVQIMLKGFQASDLIVGLLIGSLPAALGMILAPVVGVMSDRHRGGWGRRIPFLLFPVPPTVIALVGLAFTPTLGRFVHDFLGEYAPPLPVVQIAVLVFFLTLFEVACIISNSVFGGLINDVVPHEVIGRFFGLFRAVGLVAGILFNLWILGHVEEYFTWILLGLGLLYGVGFPLMCLRVKEGQYPPPPIREGQKIPLTGIRTYVRECFTNSYYLWVFFAMTLAAISFGPVNAFSIFYARSVGMGLDVYGKYVALTYAISLVLTYFLGSLADRFHPLRAGIVSAALYAAAMLWGGAFATTAERFGIAFVLHGVLSGTFMTCTASLGQRLFPRLRFAQFASALGIVSGVGYLITPPAVGILLDFSGHAYRLTFFVAGTLSLAATCAMLVVHSRFMKLGGPQYYSPPE